MKAQGQEQMEFSLDNLIIVLGRQCNFNPLELQAICHITTLVHEFQINLEVPKALGWLGHTYLYPVTESL